MKNFILFSVLILTMNMCQAGHLPNFVATNFFPNSDYQPFWPKEMKEKKTKKIQEDAKKRREKQAETAKKKKEKALANEKKVTAKEERKAAKSREKLASKRSKK